MSQQYIMPEGYGEIARRLGADAVRVSRKDGVVYIRAVLLKTMWRRITLARRRLRAGLMRSVIANQRKFDASERVFIAVEWA